jgi:hypothetical protein
MIGLASPKPAAGLHRLAEGAGKKGRKDMSPFGVIDTGVYGVRGDGWLVGLETKDSRDDLHDSQQDGFRDLAAGRLLLCRHRPAVCPRRRVHTSSLLPSAQPATALSVSSRISMARRRRAGSSSAAVINEPVRRLSPTPAAA